MKRTKSAVFGAATLMLCVSGGMCPLSSVNTPPQAPGPTEAGLPPGFVMNQFATGLHGPRFMELGPELVVLVAERGENRVVALPDANGDGIADQLVEVVTDLQEPTSLAYRDGQLYIGETSQVTRVDLAADLTASNRTAIIDDLPVGGHSTRTVCFGADDKLYVSVGSSCNVCEEADPRRAAVNVYDPDGSNHRVFATGLRNTVGLAVEPVTGAMWASNNGRDWLGDDAPPETLYILNDGADYGWPRCHAGDIVDPDFGSPSACDGVVLPVLTMQAHMAPLGIAFYTASQFPAAYRGNLFIALHGSWNRTVPVGYKVMMAPVVNGQVAGPAQDFAVGWLRPDGTVSGRPVGLLVAGDGALLVSDDSGGVIYRISYAGP